MCGDRYRCISAGNINAPEITCLCMEAELKQLALFTVVSVADSNEISRYCAEWVSAWETRARSSCLTALDARVKGGQAAALRTLESPQVSRVLVLGARLTSLYGTSAGLAVLPR